MGPDAAWRGVARETDAGGGTRGLVGGHVTGLTLSPIVCQNCTAHSHFCANGLFGVGHRRTPSVLRGGAGGETAERDGSAGEAGTRRGRGMK